MLIKITDFNDDLAERLKTFTQKNTASSAVRSAATKYMEACERNISLASDVGDLRLEIRRLNLIIENARSSAAVLVEKTS